MMKYLATIPLLLILTINIFNNIKINNQVKTILNDFESASECNHVSTKKFADGQLTDIEYLLYRCILLPDIKTLYFYVDKQNKEVVNKRVFSTNYDSIVSASPRLCITGFSKTDNKNLYDVCSIFISYESILTGRHELFFSTPLTINNNKALRERVLQQGYTQNVDDFL